MTDEYQTTISKYASSLVVWATDNNIDYYTGWAISLSTFICGVILWIKPSLIPVSIPALVLLLFTAMSANRGVKAYSRSDIRFKNGKHNEVVSDNTLEKEQGCVGCSDDVRKGDVKKLYTVYYLMGYELLRFKDGVNITCDDCCTDEVVSEEETELDIG